MIISVNKYKKNSIEHTKAVIGNEKIKMKKKRKKFKKDIDSEKLGYIIRLILKSGDQLFKCVNFINGD